MGFQFTDPVVAGTILSRPAIQSPDYVPGVSGWIIRIDGSAEFNNLSIRGEFMGNDFELTAQGFFMYSGPVAKGSMICALAPAAGADSAGNNFSAGLTLGIWSALTGNVIQHTSIDSNAISLVDSQPVTRVFAEADKSLVAIYNSGGRLAGNLLAAIAGGAGNDGVTNNFAAGYTGRVTAFQPNVSPQIPETWHTMVGDPTYGTTLQAGFAAGGQAPRFTFKPDNTVLLAGAVNLTANQAAGTAFWAAPSGYPAAVSSFYATGNSLSGYALGNHSVKVESGGAARINVAGSTGNAVQLDGIRYPLD